MKRKVKLILLVAWAGSSLLARAQADCSQALIEAERAYYTGRFGDVQSLLASCVTSGFDKDQKTEAYKLIALSNIFSKNFDRADSVLFLMLKNNPQYTFSPQDPVEFKKRVESFKVHPLIEVTANLGLLQPFFNITEIHNSRPISTTTTYQGKVGTHMGLNVAYYLTKEISFRGGYEWQQYSLTIEDKNELNTGLSTESHSRTQWQAAAGYTFSFKKISLQTYAGIVYSTLHKADAYLVLDRANASGEIEFSYSNLNQRTKNELRPLLEVKLNVLPKNSWMVSVSMRYEMGTANITNGENRYNLNRATVFEWVEDDFKGNYLSLSVGISRLFYRVKVK